MGGTSNRFELLISQRPVAFGREHAIVLYSLDRGVPLPSFMCRCPTVQFSIPKLLGFDEMFTGAPDVRESSDQMGVPMAAPPF